MEKILLIHPVLSHKGLLFSKKKIKKKKKNKKL
jgi:hypothetical protein